MNNLFFFDNPAEFLETSEKKQPLIISSKKYEATSIPVNHTCTIYILNASQLNDDTFFEYYYHLLPEIRQKKIDCYRFRQDKNLSLAAGLLLEKVLSPLGFSEMDLSYNQYRKPYIPQLDHFHFNLSHSHELAICALYQNEIGADIEKIVPIDFTKIVDLFFHYKEINAIASSIKPESTFYNYWVLKESYLKARGLGLNLSLNDFYIAYNQSIEVFEEKQKMPYSFDLKEIDNYRIALCFKGPRPELEFQIQIL